MKLSNKKVLTIVLLIIIALSGLVVLQTILLKTSLKTEEETFRSSAIFALNKAIRQLSQDEARNAIMRINFNGSLDDSNYYYEEREIVNDGNSDTIVYMIKSGFSNQPESTHQWYGYSYDFLNLMPDEDSIVKNKAIEKTRILTNNDTLWEQKEVSYENNLTFKMGTFKDSSHQIRQFFSNDSNRVLLIEAALSELDFREDIPILERIDTTLLDSVLSIALKESKINIDYSFGISGSKNDSLLFATTNLTDANLLLSHYRVSLFPFDVLARSNFLVVHFPNKQFYIYTKLGSLILPTALFMLIIIGCFIYTIQTILTQRQTTAKLNDFINNMTHELKTPISTIKLAVEAIARDDVLSNKEKVAQFNSMIDIENRRMKSHVDKILQIATLEEGDYIIKYEPVDLNLILTDAVESFEIHLQANGGSISKQLRAEKSNISGDLVHLQNIIYNLIDNALKYSSESPDISVVSENYENKLRVRIKDSGIGIHNDDLKHVFDKYYRAAGGDVHDVKGFGLGLSYVKMMAEAHGGEVEMVSVLGKGTEVILEFPLLESK